jgi:hypothetical protein
LSWGAFKIPAAGGKPRVGSLSGSQRRSRIPKGSVSGFRRREVKREAVGFRIRAWGGEVNLEVVGFRIRQWDAASTATPRCNESKERAREVLQVSPVHLDIHTQMIFRVRKCVGCISTQRSRGFSTALFDFFGSLFLVSWKRVGGKSRHVQSLLGVFQMRFMLCLQTNCN